MYYGIGPTWRSKSSTPCIAAAAAVDIDDTAAVPIFETDCKVLEIPNDLIGMVFVISGKISGTIEDKSPINIDPPRKS